MQKRPLGAALFVAQIHIWIMHCFIFSTGANLKQNDRPVRANPIGMPGREPGLETSAVNVSQNGLSLFFAQSNLACDNDHEFALLFMPVTQSRARAGR